MDGNTVTVEWQGTGPTAANRITRFDCTLGTEATVSCECTLHCIVMGQTYYSILPPFIISCVSICQCVVFNIDVLCTWELKELLSAYKKLNSDSGYSLRSLQLA